VRRAGMVCVVLFGRTALFSGQAVGARDSIGLVEALAAYAVSHPVRVGGTHGPMLGLTVDTVASRWSALPDFLRYYNADRFHMGLNGLTPMQRLRGHQ